MMAKKRDLICAAIRLVKAGNVSMFSDIRELTEAWVQSEIAKRCGEPVLQKKILERAYIKMEDEIGTLEDPDAYEEWMIMIVDEVSAKVMSTNPIQITPRVVEPIDPTPEPISPTPVMPAPIPTIPDSLETVPPSQATQEELSASGRRSKRNCICLLIIFILMCILTIYVKHKKQILNEEFLSKGQSTTEETQSTATSTNTNSVAASVDDLSAERDALYEALNEYREENGLDDMSIDYTLENAAAEFNGKVIVAISENAEDWYVVADKANDEIAVKYDIKWAGWQIHPYGGFASARDVADQIIQYNRDLYAKDSSEICLENCNAVGISVGVKDDTIMCYAIIFR